MEHYATLLWRRDSFEIVVEKIEKPHCPVVLLEIFTESGLFITLLEKIKTFHYIVNVQKVGHLAERGKGPIDIS